MKRLFAIDTTSSKKSEASGCGDEIRVSRETFVKSSKAMQYFNWLLRNFSRPGDAETV